MIENKNILITGATGSIGCHLVRRLAVKNKIFCIVRAESNIDKIVDIDNLTIIKLNGDYSLLFNQLKKLNIDITFHLASLILAEHRSEDVEMLLQSNVVFPVQILDILMRCGYRKVINVSTYAENYKNSYSPTSLYASSKKAFEDILQYYIDIHKFSAISLHLYHVFGKKCKSFIRLLDNAMVENKELNLSPGEQTLDLVYIDDVIDAFLLAGVQLLISAPIDKHYGVYSKNPLKLKEIANVYEKVHNVKLNAKWGSLPYRKIEFFEQSYPYEKQVGFKCKYSLMEALDKDIKDE